MELKPMISFDRVTKRYHKHTALGNVSFQLHQGEMVFLTGHSGAGKSTLLRLIMLLERSSAGEVTIKKKKLSKIRSRGIPALRRSMGVVLQDHRLLFDRSVYDNVALPLQVAGHRAKEIETRVTTALHKVRLEKRSKSLPITLSAGEQQRVGIARAVVNLPSILIADEPTGNLDPKLAKEIMELFAGFSTNRTTRMTVLIATHDIALVKAMKKRTLHLENGRLKADKPAQKS